MYRKFFFFIILPALCLLTACDNDKVDLSNPPVIRVATATITENDQSAEIRNFNASIEKSWPEDLLFFWSLEGMTALPGSDFKAVSDMQAVIPAGMLAVSLPVEIIDDTLMEFTEQFLIRIRQEGRQDRQTIITILNDDYLNPEWTVEGAETSLLYPGMQLVWHDEFDGNAIKTEYWNYDEPGGFPVNCGGNDGQIAKYTGDMTHLRLDDGRLIITATVDTATGIYRSARINSKEKINISFGRIDIRAKLAGGSGLASGFSMIGSNGEWPASGEIEIAKMAGRQPGSITAGLVYDNEGARYVEKQLNIESNNPELTDIFHIYTILWDNHRIIWLLDYMPYYSISRLEFPGTYLYNDPFFFRVNLAVGGLFAGDPFDPAVFPSDLEVDYIRVYQPIETNTNP
jgi:beta-glucanase (GH16 family)